MKKFPKTLYAKIEDDGDTHYFVATEKMVELAEVGETVKVGVYELVNQGEVEGAAVFHQGGRKK